MSTGKIVILTGANRGLGLGIAKVIAARPEPITLVAASRAGVDLQLKGSHPGTVFDFQQLDITDQTSVERLLSYVKTKYGRVDILINNAGASFEPMEGGEFNADTIRKTFDINYRGTLKVTQAFLPLIPPQGRVVNVSTGAACQITFGNGQLKRQLLDQVPDLNLLNDLAREYESVPLAPETEDGWTRPGQAFGPIYSTSKAFVNIMTASLAKSHPEVLINAVCPGCVDTDMLPPEFPYKKKSAEQSAKTILPVAFEDIRGITGKFWMGKTPAALEPVEVLEDWPGHDIGFET